MVRKLGYYTSVFHGARAVLESHHVGMDLIMCVLGRSIADGNYRAVYEHAHDPSLVVKLEYGHESKNEHDCIMENSFCNVQEFLLWREIEGLTGDYAWVKDWFAPVEWISPGGHLLCMQKTEECPGRERPEKVPSFFADVKWSNFGWIGDRFVCHDYAHVNTLVYYKKRYFLGAGELIKPVHMCSAASNDLLDLVSY